MNRRNALMGLLSMAAAIEAAEGAPSRWPDAVFPLASSKIEHDSFGDTVIYHEGATGQLKSITAGTLVLKPGEEPHPPHQHPEEEFMIVAEGTGIIVVNGKTTKVGPGDLMYCQGNRLHGIKNTGSAPMRFYFFKWLG